MTPALRRLDDAELFAWLRLIRSDNVGPSTFRALMGRFGSATAALDALPGLPRRAPGRAVVAASPRAVEAEMDAARRAGVTFLPLCDPAYPPSLRAADDAPPLLAVKGQAGILQRPAVAVVGSRNASAVGLLVTERLAAELGQGGFAVVSGLARGIDARAHRASLPTGTVAVLAGGHARVYPTEHMGLAEEIAAIGAVVSEMPLNWEPRGRDFPRRNRIVSGLSLGVVVVEAALRSGSLITARFAGEQGREVFAVPGSAVDPRAEGTNDLLRQGATLCTRAAHVIEALGPAAGGMHGLREAPASRAPDPGSLYWDEWDAAGSTPELEREPDNPAPVGEDAAARRRIADLIGAAPVSVDELVRVAEAPVGVVLSVLVELEVEGQVLRHPNNAVSRLPA